jgi:hypothetical protein
MKRGKRMKYTDKKSIIAMQQSFICICPNNHRYWDINLGHLGNKSDTTSWFILLYLYIKPVNMKNGKKLKPIALEIISCSFW